MLEALLATPAAATVETAQVVVPSLLAALTHSAKVVRQAALRCLALIRRNVASSAVNGTSDAKATPHRKTAAGSAGSAGLAHHHGPASSKALESFYGSYAHLCRTS